MGSERPPAEFLKNARQERVNYEPERTPVPYKPDFTPETKPTNPKDEYVRHGHPMFYDLLQRMADIHSKKNHDYAGDEDPLRNLRAVERSGVDAVTGVFVRMVDKWSRLEQFMRTGVLEVKEETIEDTLIDLANYSLLMIIIMREARKIQGSDIQAGSISYGGDPDLA